ncbi:hypothetical protein IT575_08490 [bacterium]|nr:hypothetical protein [bacterium]
MSRLDHLRIAALAVLLLLLQLAWYSWFPALRAGFDLYVPLVLLLTARRGPGFGGIYALAGALVMDAFSLHLPAFHLFFYLLPVMLGSLLRSRILTEYKQLGVIAVAALLLLKIIIPLLLGMLSHELNSLLYLFEVSYISPLLICAALWLAWPALLRLVPAELEGQRYA